MKRTLIFSSAVAFGLLATITTSHAADTWTGAGTDNNWLPFPGDNWNGGAGTNTILEGDAGDSITDLAGATGSIAGLQIRGGHTLNVNTGAALNVSGNINMGATGTGTVIQSGGSVNLGESLNLTGDDSSFYTISGGTLTTDGMDVGAVAASTFTIDASAAGTPTVEVAGALDAGEFSSFSFNLGSSGIDAIDQITTMTIIDGAALTIGGSSYTGGAGIINLFSYTSLADGTEFAESISGFTGFTTDVIYGSSGIDLQLTAIPEPSTFALLGGLFALTSVMLRRRR